MKAIQSFPSIFIHVNPIDFRKGLLSLSAFIQAEMNLSPFSGSLFIFINKKKNYLKAIYWDKTGFAMWCKLLDQEKFPWPKNFGLNQVCVSEKQIDWLLKGIDPWKLKCHKELNFEKII